MAKVQIAVSLLRLPDGRLVFQRRGAEAPTSPNLLGLFGGHVENQETADDAVVRELREETSLDVSKLKFKKLGASDIDNRQFFFYQTDIKDAGFEVYEGERAEIYSDVEAASRDDLTKSSRMALELLNG